MSILTRYINIPVFLLSFAFGVFAVYVTLPDVKRIMVYPSPDNVDYIQYKDKANHYFRFQEKKVKCPVQEKMIYSIPVQA